MVKYAVMQESPTGWPTARLLTQQALVTVMILDALVGIWFLFPLCHNLGDLNFRLLPFQHKFGPAGVPCPH